MAEAATDANPWRKGHARIGPGRTVARMGKAYGNPGHGTLILSFRYIVTLAL